MVVGSLYLFPSEGFLPAVNPILAILVSLLVAGFLWLVTRKAVATLHARPLQDLKSLIGQIGQAKTEVFRYGFRAGGQRIVECPQCETHSGREPRPRGQS